MNQGKGIKNQSELTPMQVTDKNLDFKNIQLQRNQSRLAIEIKSGKECFRMVNLWMD